MELSINVVKDADIVTNVMDVVNHYSDALEKYRGVVATPETVKDDKKACANIRKLKKMIADERIAFDKAVAGLPCVKAVHDSLKSVESKCDEMVLPYWESIKAVEEALKPTAPEPLVNATLAVSGVTMKVLDKIVQKMLKDGIKVEVKIG